MALLYFIWLCIWFQQPRASGHDCLQITIKNNSNASHYSDYYDQEDCAEWAWAKAQTCQEEGGGEKVVLYRERLWLLVASGLGFAETASTRKMLDCGRSDIGIILRSSSFVALATNSKELWKENEVYWSGISRDRSPEILGHHPAPASYGSCSSQEILALGLWSILL